MTGEHLARDLSRVAADIGRPRVTPAMRQAMAVRLRTLACEVRALEIRARRNSIMRALRWAVGLEEERS